MTSRYREDDYDDESERFGSRRARGRFREERGRQPGSHEHEESGGWMRGERPWSRNEPGEYEEEFEGGSQREYGQGPRRASGQRYGQGGYGQQSEFGQGYRGERTSQSGPTWSGEWGTSGPRSPRGSGYAPGGGWQGGMNPSERSWSGSEASGGPGGFGGSRGGWGSSRDHRGKGPKGYQRSDERIKEDINEQLTQDPDIDATELEVEVEKGVVTLRGTIDSREMKWRVESLTDEVSGVKDVQNQVRVQRHEQGSYPSDSGRAGYGQRGSTTGKHAGSSTQ